MKIRGLTVCVSLAYIISVFNSVDVGEQCKYILITFLIYSFDGLLIDKLILRLFYILSLPTAMESRQKPFNYITHESISSSLDIEGGTGLKG